MKEREALEESKYTQVRNVRERRTTYDVQERRKKERNKEYDVQERRKGKEMW